MKISSSRLLLIVAALIALTTASAIAYILWSRPVELRVAAGPADGKDSAILAAFDRMLETNGAGVRLKLVATGGLHDSNELLGKREVDLAVVRLDEALPDTAALVVICAPMRSSRSLRPATSWRTRRTSPANGWASSPARRAMSCLSPRCSSFSTSSRRAEKRP